MSDCLFCRITSGAEPSWKIYEDADHLGFLTPYPNTPGFSVLVTKEHRDSNVLHLDQQQYLSMMLSARALAHRIEEKLGVARVGLVIEGMGIDHAHVKLIPMHGIDGDVWKPIVAAETRFSDRYEGYLSTHDGPRMSDEELFKIQRRLLQNTSHPGGV